MAVRQTQDQRRARAAWDAVRQVMAHDEGVRQEYQALARGFAAMIQVNGFGPACAFLYAKKNRQRKDRKNGEQQGPSAHELLLDQLQSWLRQQPWLHVAEADEADEAAEAHVQAREATDHETDHETDQDWLIRWITRTASAVEYRRAMVETLAFFLWLRRFAEGALDEPEGATERGGVTGASSVTEAIGKERQ